MPGMNGIEAVAQIHRNYPKIKILMQTVFEDEEKVFRSIIAGASGYILKNESSTSYVNSIRNIYQGGIPMTSVIAQKVLNYFRVQNEKNDLQDAGFSLTPREIEVLNLLSQGKSHKMIAGELFISIHTVDSHIRNIYEKLQVNCVAEAVSKAFLNKLI
jgi:DNA-binding NarL/FixJ family response regulator